jgi:hypothetical protein
MIVFWICTVTREYVEMKARPRFVSVDDSTHTYESIDYSAAT